MVFEGQECTLEILLEYSRANNFLTLLSLWTSLSIVLAHILIIGSTKTDYTLFSFMAYIDTNEHRLLRNLRSKVKSPQISSEFCVNLPQNVDVDSIIVFLNGFTRNKLGDNWAISVNLVFKSGVQMFLLN